jgi:hypothetical protein
MRSPVETADDILLTLPPNIEMEPTLPMVRTVIDRSNAQDELTA